MRSPLVDDLLLQLVGGNDPEAARLEALAEHHRGLALAAAQRASEAEQLLEALRALPPDDDATYSDVLSALQREAHGALQRCGEEVRRQENEQTKRRAEARQLRARAAAGYRIRKLLPPDLLIVADFLSSAPDQEEDPLC